MPSCTCLKIPANGFRIGNKIGEPAHAREWRWEVDFETNINSRYPADAGSFGMEAMPNPQDFRTGGYVRFIGMPYEWSRPGYTLNRDNVSFMNYLIRRAFPTRVQEIDE